MKGRKHVRYAKKARHWEKPLAGFHHIINQAIALLASQEAFSGTNSGIALNSFIH
jgi:hypothetical protein